MVDVSEIEYLKKIITTHHVFPSIAKQEGGTRKFYCSVAKKGDCAVILLPKDLSIVNKFKDISKEKSDDVMFCKQCFFEKVWIAKRNRYECKGVKKHIFDENNNYIGETDEF
jgi:hypothetical protein